jgi:hypothetical protein
MLFFDKLIKGIDPSCDMNVMKVVWPFDEHIEPEYSESRGCSLTCPRVVKLRKLLASSSIEEFAGIAEEVAPRNCKEK